MPLARETETRPVQTHATSDHLHQTADSEAMEAARAEEAFLLEKEDEGMKDNGRRVTSITLGEMTLAEMAMVTTEATTRDRRDGGPQHRDATFMKTERCSPGAGREKGKKSGSLTFLKLRRKSPCGWTRLPTR